MTFPVTVTEKAYAKVNLSLDVLGKRPDGYHDMKLIFQSVSLHDDVTLKLTSGSGNISVETDKEFIPGGEKNLGYSACRAFFRAAGISNVDVSLSIVKRIPVCAGLGGGSSDAAAVLRALNRALEAGLSPEELRRAAKTVDSDSAFCVSGGTALGCGRGTELKRLKPLMDCGIVILKPSFSVSTPALFSRLDSVRVRVRPDTDGLISAIEAGDYTGTARRVFNVFEEALPPAEKRTVEEAKSLLYDLGADSAAMTGTGSAVFGLFSHKELGRKAAETAQNKAFEAFFTEPVGYIE